MQVKFLFTLLTVASLFYSCSGLEKSERNKIKKLNAKKEAIYRKHTDLFYLLEQPKKIIKNPYFWENKVGNNIPLITKEYFRCKGNFSNPPGMLNANTSHEKYHYDCSGFDEHSLPVKDEKEFVYPALIEILNYIQEKASKKVAITCGHRCPKHNSYCEPHSNKSKHLVGAEVDFYVLGLEYSPEEVVSLIKQYYEEKETSFGTLQKRGSSDIKLFENKEVAVRVYSETQGRDFDNRHPYPYLSIELKYDRALKKAVYYNWHSSNKTVMKW